MASLTYCASNDADQHPRYPLQLRKYYSINAALKRDGILAPGNSSIESTAQLYELIGRPLDKILTLHVGGTNGKGSTCYKLYEAMKANKFRTGLFVSPHLASFRERMVVNDELISENLFVEYLDRIISISSQNNIPATEFEVAFLMAAMYFADKGCDVVVLEVGLGGEYDATNVVSTALSIICSVSLDHTRILGPTVEAIATTKAGIAKPNKPILVGPGVPIAAIEAVASQKNAIFYSYETAADEFKSAFMQKNIEFCENDGTSGNSASPVVDVNALNTNIALLGLLLLQKHYPDVFGRIDLSSHAYELQSIDACPRNGSNSDSNNSSSSSSSSGGVLNATYSALLCLPPCRWERHMIELVLAEAGSDTASKNVDNVQFEVMPQDCSRNTTHVPRNNRIAVEVVLDVGHNPAAVSALARKLKHQYNNRNVRMVYAMSRDKDVRTCLRTVAAVVPHDHIHFVQSKNFRAVSKQDMNHMYMEETGKEMVDITGSSVSEVLTEVMRMVVGDVNRHRQQENLEQEPQQQQQQQQKQQQHQQQCPVVVICGTGYIMPEARAFIGIQEPRDELDLQRDNPQQQQQH